MGPENCPLCRAPMIDNVIGLCDVCRDHLTIPPPTDDEEKIRRLLEAGRGDDGPKLYLATRLISEANLKLAHETGARVILIQPGHPRREIRWVDKDAPDPVA